MKKLLFLFLTIFTFQINGFATHISGGHTQITKLGSDTFEIKVNIIRDCSGIFAPATVPITITDSCGYTANSSASQFSSFFFSPFCTASGNSTCNGGQLPGYEIVEYRDTVVFSSSCNSVFAFADLGCCRPNTSNLQNAMNANIVVMAMLNRNNPIGTTPPSNYLNDMVHSLCANSIGTIMVDSLPLSYDANYEFYNPLGSIGNTIPFTAPNTVMSPFSGASINSSNGLISVMPSAIGDYAIPVKTTILASNPNWASYAKFEMRARVTICNDTLAPSVSISNAGDFYQNGDTLSPCAPNSCFDLLISDNLTTASLDILTTNLPITSISGNNPKTITVCPSVNSGTEKYYLVVEDQCGGIKTTKFIYVNATTNPPLTGTVSSTNGPVTNTLVLMVGLDTSAGQVYAVDSTTTDISGNYSFNAIPAPLVMIKAIPDSTAYPMLIPTYHDSALTALSAKTLPQYCYHPIADIMMQSGTNPGGSGFIAGNVYQGAGKNGAGDPVNQLALILKNTNGELVAQKTTNGSGYFKFSGLTNESYQLFVDNGSVNNQNPPAIDLSQNNEVTLNLNLFETELVIESFVSINQNSQNLISSISPNPFNEELILNIAKQGNYHLKIVDTFGKTVVDRQINLNQGNNALFFNELANGIYFLKVTLGEEIAIHKLVKQ